jgi:hypothetical protein
MGEVTIHIRKLEDTPGKSVEIEVAHDDVNPHDWREKPPLDAPKEVQLAYIAIDAIRRATPEQGAACPKCLSNKVLATEHSFECASCGFRMTLNAPDEDNKAPVIDRNSEENDGGAQS